MCVDSVSVCLDDAVILKLYSPKRCEVLIDDALMISYLLPVIHIINSCTTTTSLRSQHL